MRLLGVAGNNLGRLAPATEDLLRLHRERDRLGRERTARINRIKGLLWTTKPWCRRTWRFSREIVRQIQRLALVIEDLAGPGVPFCGQSS